ncbi:MAG: tyrosine-type recombinase/integrase, partial [Spirochaetaceae bacterium]|nr:tyrosine-type recombinase/integrase [Spirochaetaceae bacterium]
MDYKYYERALKCLILEADKPMDSIINLKAMHFKKLLYERKMEYSLENVSCILKLLFETEKTKKSFLEYREIQFKIASKIFDKSEIQEKLFLHTPYPSLQPWIQDIIEKIILLKPDINTKLSSSIRSNLSFFFEKFINYTSFDSFSKISIILLHNFLVENENYAPHYLFWRYYVIQQNRQYLFLEHMHDTRIAKHLLFTTDLNIDLMKFPNEISVSEYYVASKNIINDMKNDGYSKNSIIEPQRAFNTFGLFLEVNGLRYSKELAHLWALEMKKRFKINMINQEHYLIFANIYIRGQRDIKLFRVHSENKIDFPMWAQKSVNEYLSERSQDGLEKKTISMDRCCLIRFITFLDLISIKSFESVTPGIVKEFNLQDINHKTPESKNAYNTRIRGFLRYIERTIAIKFCLADALSCCSAISIRPVKVLSAEEDALLKNAMTLSEGSPTILRDIAIVKLERFLGLRISDVLALRFQSINILKMEINIIQKKTHKQLILPLPNTVLNSIIRYIENERPNIDSEYIFLTSRYPLKPLESVNIPLLENLFEERVHCKNHILRKTLSTEMLCSGSSV